MNLNIKNKKAFYDYQIEKKLEAGIVLQGWEAKCIKGSRCQIRDAYIKIINNEAYIIGMNITPTNSVSMTETCDPTRTRKLLLNRKEISSLSGEINNSGYTIIPLDLHLKNNKIKLTIALAKGKSQKDKRSTMKENDWKREKERLNKNKLR